MFDTLIQGFAVVFDPSNASDLDNTSKFFFAKENDYPSKIPSIIWLVYSSLVDSPLTSQSVVCFLLQDALAYLDPMHQSLLQLIIFYP